MDVASSCNTCIGHYWLLLLINNKLIIKCVFFSFYSGDDYDSQAPVKLALKREVRLWPLAKGRDFWIVFDEMPHDNAPIDVEFKTDMSGANVILKKEVLEIDFDCINYDDPDREDKTYESYEMCYTSLVKSHLQDQASCQVAELEVG